MNNLANNPSTIDCCIKHPVLRYTSDGVQERLDRVVQELQMSIVLDGAPLYTFTCSPWDIEELAVGYLFCIGAITKLADIDTLAVEVQEGIIDVSLRQASAGLASLEGSSAGAAPPFNKSNVTVSAAEVNAVVELLRSSSPLFQRTGGVHSAALIKEGSVVAWFDDIGRHIVLNKLVGWCVLNDFDASNCVLLFSGRVPQEIIAKAIKLGCPIIVALGAPTSLSIKLAEQAGITLIGFARNSEFNIYSHPNRVSHR